MPFCTHCHTNYNIDDSTREFYTCECQQCDPEYDSEDWSIRELTDDQMDDWERRYYGPPS